MAAGPQDLVDAGSVGLPAPGMIELQQLRKPKDGIQRRA